MKIEKDLREVTLDALNLFSSKQLPDFKIGEASNRLIVASGNALETGKILFEGERAIFAGEDQYEKLLETMPIDGAVVISASGEKHAPIIVSDLVSKKIDTTLLTCKGNSSAAKILKEMDESLVIETPSIDEPITYNTSTYMGMILAKTREDTGEILKFITDVVEPTIPDITKYSAFYLLLKPKFDLERQMFITKFDELFGPLINGRCYTVDQTLHAKTVIESDSELFISFGYDNKVFGKEGCKLNIPMRENAGHAEMMAVGYYVIGRLQSQLHPWFKEAAPEYVERQKQLFKKVLG